MENKILVNSQEKHILKAIAETTIYQLSDCINVYLVVDSYDSTLSILDVCAKTAVPIGHYLDAFRSATQHLDAFRSATQHLDAFRSATQRPIIIEKESLLKRFINWVKRQLN